MLYLPEATRLQRCSSAIAVNGTGEAVYADSTGEAAGSKVFTTDVSVSPLFRRYALYELG